jgi:hypothetical protein
VSAVVSTPLLAAVAAAAVVTVAFTALGLMRQVRLRRHLNRLRTLPIETGRRK